MFDDEIYDPILEELRSISETMKELEKLISQQISIENANNILLRKLTECQQQTNDKKHIDHMDVEKYRNQNLLISNTSLDESIKIAKLIASDVQGKLIISDAKSDSELAALISGATPGDIVFVDVSNPLFDNKMKTIVYDCVKEQCINVSIGKGTGARSVRLDIPEITFILFAYLEEFLPNDLKRLLLCVG